MGPRKPEFTKTRNYGIVKMVKSSNREIAKTGFRNVKIAKCEKRKIVKM
jgi:hypothetical protein